MEKYLKLFENHAQYEEYISGKGAVIPNVSHCIQEVEVHYKPKKDYAAMYLTFEILTDGTIEWNEYGGKRDYIAKTIYYSKDDGENWNVLDNSNSNVSIDVEEGEKVIFKGENEWYGEISDYDYWNNFRGTAEFNLYGNILSLFYGDDFKKYTELPEIHYAEVDNYEKHIIFIFALSNVVSAENLILPTNTASSCYYNMFAKCYKLIAAPKLPATTLSDYCYGGMFSDCTSLTTAPKLRATTLAENCYGGMFAGCTNLITAPKLLATTLAESCYNGMFNGCTSLVTAPELPATTLASNCYNSMFSGCTSISKAPELPATTLANYCYYRMFEWCTSLTEAPELRATELSDWCYAGMFYGCTSLTTAPELPATTLKERCYSYMLARCTSLTTAPDLIATKLVSECYFFMFEGSTNLNYIKAMFTTKPGVGYTSHWVDGVSSSGTFVKNSAATWNVRGGNGIPSGWTIETAIE